jgi:hypothetical protein
MNKNNENDNTNKKSFNEILAKFSGKKVIQNINNKNEDDIFIKETNTFKNNLNINNLIQIEDKKTTNNKAEEKIGQPNMVLNRANQFNKKEELNKTKNNEKIEINNKNEKTTTSNNNFKDALKVFNSSNKDIKIIEKDKKDKIEKNNIKDNNVNIKETPKKEVNKSESKNTTNLIEEKNNNSNNDIQINKNNNFKDKINIFNSKENNDSDIIDNKIKNENSNSEISMNKNTTRIRSVTIMERANLMKGPTKEDKEIKNINKINKIDKNLENNIKKKYQY